MDITSCLWAFNCTWRSCDSPHRPSTAAWQIDGSGAWIPRCSQTVPSVIHQLQREHSIKRRQSRTSCPWWSTNLSRSDLNVKVVPLVWNLEDFRPSKSVYPESVFVHQEPVGTHAQHDVHTLRVLQELNTRPYAISRGSLQSIFGRLPVLVRKNQIQLWNGLLLSSGERYQITQSGHWVPLKPANTPTRSAQSF